MTIKWGNYLERLDKEAATLRATAEQHRKMAALSDAHADVVEAMAAKTRRALEAGRCPCCGEATHDAPKPAGPLPNAILTG